jgi:hypothetical protein
MSAPPQAPKSPQPKDRKIGMWLDDSRIHKQFNQRSRSVFDLEWATTTARLLVLSDRAFLKPTKERMK